MGADEFRPIVAIEVNGLLGIPLPPAIATAFANGTGADITYRRESFPTRFATEPRWNVDGEYTQSWAFLGRGVNWVKTVLQEGVEVVWASRYQQATNLYFSKPLGFPDLPVATLDDGRLYTTEAEWKASQLGAGRYDGRPLLWITDELTIAGRYLLDRSRKPADRAISYTKFIPDSASDGDVQFMNEWLDLARSSSGQRELRQRRASLMRRRRIGNYSTERIFRDWRVVRSRLAGVLDFRSGLAAPLAAYAVEHAGELDVRVVAQIREEWGLSSDPPAAELLPLLEL